ncbi:RagB/SusD family nutrient uptake outer membrane protein [Sphingobacterium chuzhouense]|uniref:RagB/SusD family nutrient uptake outer membrane protein n=1 Tax=Sphingobacterium chuzhouense TaxID=1742264 RepID=A0ABR7XRR7_9SPHI|nr:RagB/SusD family nutrient uptake outer membrane protein [Sphingobacterium chuzhouense]MBD1421582.1 RagB/SusD family nutrient uptake outer membrane protein [Sphingobacterium chuzhouense]
MKRKLIYLYIVVAGILLQSCNKYLDIQPVGTVVPSTESDFRALLTMGYATFPSHKSLLLLRTDELILDPYSDDVDALRDIYIWNDESPAPTTLSYPWEQFYKSIFYANLLLTEIDSKLGDNDVTKQMKAEAYLLRAYGHFELLNCYAPVYNEANKQHKGVPIAEKIDLEQNFPVSTMEEVYTFITADIQHAMALLQTADQPSNHRYRFSKRAVHAFAARLHLYRSEWGQALSEAQAALAIEGGLVDLNIDEALLPNDFESVESIQALDNPMTAQVNSSTSVSEDMLALYDRVNDKRFARYFEEKSGGEYKSRKGGNNKFKVSFRNGELYLIVAEAALHSERKEVALEALQTLAKHRLTGTAATEQTADLKMRSVSELLNFVQVERARELALEGLRWYDLKRWGRPEIQHVFLDKTYTLQAGDPRYTIRYPKEAVENNPELL